MNSKCPTPVAFMQPYTSTDPTPCLTVDTRYVTSSCEFGILKFFANTSKNAKLTFICKNKSIPKFSIIVSASAPFT